MVNAVIGVVRKDEGPLRVTGEGRKTNWCERMVKGVIDGKGRRG
jgi:hypothetical protein